LTYDNMEPNRYFSPQFSNINGTVPELQEAFSPRFFLFSFVILRHFPAGECAVGIDRLDKPARISKALRTFTLFCPFGSKDRFFKVF